MTQTEIWKEIPGYPGRYEASTWGRVRSIMGKEPRLLTLNTYKNSPYFKVQLIDATGHRKWYRVHRLIYTTFLGPIPEGMVIDHISGDKADCSLDNLRICTPAQNASNPNTRQNYRKRYHHPGEHERRSAGQKRRFQRPEEYEHILRISAKGRATAKRNREQRRRKHG